MPTKIPRAKSKPEEMFALHIRAMEKDYPWLQGEVKRNHVFSPPRKWMIDFAWPDDLLAVEIEGGTRPFWKVLKSGKKVKVQQGRHITPQGFEDDCEKYNALTEQGWRLFRFTSRMVKDGRAIEQIRRVLG